MIKVILIGHNYEYEIKELLKLFLNAQDIEIYCEDEDLHLNFDFKNQDYIISKLQVEKSQVIVTTNSSIKGAKNSTENYYSISGSRQEIKKKSKYHVKANIFKLLKQYIPVNIPWGMLTGIRPTKIAHELIAKDLQDDTIINHLVEKYYISKEKALLLLEVAKTEHKYIYPIDKNKVSVYISIPFCPTRCVYCSFPSNPLKKWGKYINEYIDCLSSEIKGIGQLLQEKGKVIESIYIGGGTPTTLNVEEFNRLFDIIYTYFDVSNLKEFTVEAGRPDTIDIEKLKNLKNRGVTRISINPQTMNDCTLMEIGRNHTVKETIEAYQLATEAGFSNINLDIIIGLPGENLQMVLHTMKEIEKLAPSNLTVHTLAIKNASGLKGQQYDGNAKDFEVMDMLRVAAEYASRMGLRPYYMYRQKHMVGNLENVGYAKPGYECIYNIQIMEEKQTIIGLGAGAVSKFVYPEENRLERIPNVKDLQQYLTRAEEMIERKEKLL
ncbi:MAG: coproporphyrinogen dehydrogenase HemZ [Clostridiaceae bacterium]|nr:coproporphyrinogen dehydrogenase HemZ [Clostridiaceae bacterium]